MRNLPLDPLAAMIADFQRRGGTIWACPPCAAARGYGPDDLLPGIIIAGGSAMFAQVRQGAAILSF